MVDLGALRFVHAKTTSTATINTANIPMILMTWEAIRLIGLLRPQTMVGSVSGDVHGKSRIHANRGH
jgi:hypothetical protein